MDAYQHSASSDLSHSRTLAAFEWRGTTVGPPCSVCAGIDGMRVLESGGRPETYFRIVIMTQISAVQIFRFHPPRRRRPNPSCEEQGGRHRQPQVDVSERYSQVDGMLCWVTPTSGRRARACASAQSTLPRRPCRRLAHPLKSAMARPSPVSKWRGDGSDPRPVPVSKWRREERSGAERGEPSRGGVAGEAFQKYASVGVRVRASRSRRPVVGALVLRARPGRVLVVLAVEVELDEDLVNLPMQPLLL